MDKFKDGTLQMPEEEPSIDPEPEQLSECPKCRGFGFLHPVIDGKPDYSQSVPCECVKLEIMDRAYHRIFDHEYRMFKDCDYTDFGEVGERCIGALESGQGLYLYGAVGVGKTRLALSALKWGIQNQIYGLIFVVSDLLDQVQKNFNDKDGKTKTEEMFQLYVGCRILVMDEFGLKPYTEWECQNLYKIIDDRWRQRDEKITIITGNYDLGEIIDRGGSRHKDLEMPHYRLVSRIQDMCMQVHMVGKDRRLNG